MDAEILSRRTLRFVNVAHALDHFVLLIYPTAVIAIAAQTGLSYGELIKLATGAFVAFGLCALPMGWLADRFGRRNMLAIFFFGYGLFVPVRTPRRPPPAKETRRPSPPLPARWVRLSVASEVLSSRDTMQTEMLPHSFSV